MTKVLIVFALGLFSCGQYHSAKPGTDTAELFFVNTKKVCDSDFGGHWTSASGTMKLKDNCYYEFSECESKGSYSVEPGFGTVEFETDVSSNRCVDFKKGFQKCTVVSISEKTLKLECPNSNYWYTKN